MSAIFSRGVSMTNVMWYWLNAEQLFPDMGFGAQSALGKLGMIEAEAQMIIDTDIYVQSNVYFQTHFCLLLSVVVLRPSNI